MKRLLILTTLPLFLSSSWALDVEIRKFVDKFEPYENCSMKDRSKCTMKNVGHIEVRILKLHKGEYASTVAKLKTAHCAPSFPKEKGKYFFFGRELGYYQGYIQLP